MRRVRNSPGAIERTQVEDAIFNTDSSHQISDEILVLLGRLLTIDYTLSNSGE